MRDSTSVSTHNFKRAVLTSESLTNWRADQNAGFRVSGFSRRYERRMSSFEPGDLIFCYVAGGRLAIADVRMVRENTDRLEKPYWDDPFRYPVLVPTKPYITLIEASWLPVRELVHKIELLRDGKLRNKFRTLRILNQADARTILCMMASKSR